MKIALPCTKSEDFFGVEHVAHQNQLPFTSKANLIPLFSSNIKRENFPVFDMVANDLLRGDGHWKISFTCWLSIFTNAIEYTFICLWLCIDIFYWGNRDAGLAHRKRYRRLKFNVFNASIFLAL